MDKVKFVLDKKIEKATAERDWIETRIKQLISQINSEMQSRFFNPRMAEELARLMREQNQAQAEIEKHMKGYL